MSRSRQSDIIASQDIFDLSLTNEEIKILKDVCYVFSLYHNIMSTSQNIWCEKSVHLQSNTL